MRRLLLTLTLLAGFATTGSLVAQYSAIGARLGSPISASYKFFLNETAAVEAFAGFRSRKINFGSSRFGWTAINVGGLYQVHNDLNLGDITGLQWYYGAGASVYFWSYDDGFLDADNYGSTLLGLHGVLGLDYVFDSAPVNLSLDWIPTFILGEGYSTGFGAGYGALSVRYIIGRR